MIEGFHVDITGKEMKELLLERQKYHGEKAAVYEKKATEIEAAFKGVDDEMQVGKVSNSSADDLRTRARKHRDSEIFYKFAAEHTPLSETFRLDRNDLQLLGLLQDRYY